MIMIWMFVCEENSVKIFKTCMRFCGKHSWISQNSFSFCFDQETTMSELGDFHKINEEEYYQQCVGYRSQISLRKISHYVLG